MWVNYSRGFEYPVVRVMVKKKSIIVEFEDRLAYEYTIKNNSKELIGKMSDIANNAGPLQEFIIKHKPKFKIYII